MEALWELGSATVNEVVAELDKTGSVTYKTTQSMLRILEDKAYVQHSKQSRSFVYSPLVSRRDASLAATKQLISRFFNNSPQSLVANLLEEEALDAQDLEQLRSLIDESE